MFVLILLNICSPIPIGRGQKILPSSSSLALYCLPIGVLPLPPTSGILPSNPLILGFCDLLQGVTPNDNFAHSCPPPYAALQLTLSPQYYIASSQDHLIQFEFWSIPQ